MPSALLNRNHRDPLFPYTTLPQTSSVDVQSIISCYHQHNFTMPLMVWLRANGVHSLSIVVKCQKVFID